MSIPAWARVGAKVVCVDNHDAIDARGNPIQPLIVGEVYRIERLYVERHRFRGEVVVGPCVSLAGVQSAKHGWSLSRFRPLITQSDDISAHFQHHLSNPVREEA